MGLRLSPLNSYNSMSDSDPVGVTTYIAQQISARGLAFLHVMRADFLGQQSGDVLTPARQHFTGTLISNMRYGLTRQSYDSTGIQSVPYVTLRSIDNLYPTTRSLAATIPTHNIADDFTWNRQRDRFCGLAIRIVGGE